MGLGKKNVVKTGLKNYVHLILGEPKIGKTTLVADIIEEEAGSLDKGLFVEIGDETGFELLDGLVYEAPQIWKELKSIVDEFLKGDHDFEYIVLDTINEWTKLADEQTIKDWYSESGDVVSSVNGTFGGYGRGVGHAIDLYSEQLKRLKLSDYGVFLIGHNKVKTEKKAGGDEYNVVTSDLFSNYYGAFAKKASIICNIIMDTDVEDGNLQKAERVMHFRSDNFVKAGSRTVDIKPKEVFGAKNYISVVKDAIQKTKDKKHKTTKEFKEVSGTDGLGYEYDKTLDENKEDIMEFVEKIQESKDDANDLIMKVLSDNDVDNPTTIEDNKVASKVAKELKELI